jgi:DNA mismatch repair protein MutS2
VQCYPEDTPQLFEFDRVLEQVELRCRCASSKAMAREIRPIEQREALLANLRQVEEFRHTLSNQGYFPDLFFEDFITEANLLAKAGSMLSEAQFSRIRSASITVNSLLRFLKERSVSFPALLQLCSGVSETKAVIDPINAIIDAQGQVKSQASDALLEIRQLLASQRREADKRFRSFINDLKKRGWLRDNEENFYNERRVLAVPSEHKRDIRGIIHGKSDTGRTTFIEPEALVELNNSIAELEQDERSEVLRLLRELSDRLRPHALLIRAYHELLTRFDLIRAKAYFALEIGAIMPHLSERPVVKLQNALHPLLYLKNKALGKSVVPLSLELDADKRILIISGPNAGGKSITLKTVGLLQLMLQSGLLVPVQEGSEMGLFRHLLADIGDSQSIEYALSTYSSRLIRMNHFLRMANNRSLVLIDEFGTGTDPELGGAIAEVVLEEINRRKAFGVFTTHYTNIKLLADRLEGVTNASMLFEPETLQPRYQLIVGQPGSSYTFEVAERIGLPEHVLNRAKKKVQKEKLRLNNLLADLHRQKAALEREVAELERRKHRTDVAEQRYEQLSQKLEERLERDKGKREELRKLAELGRKMQAFSEEWEKSKDKKHVIKKFVGNMTAERKKKAAENTPEKVAKRKAALLEKLRREISIGSPVRMMKSRQVGVVEDIRKDQVCVLFGNMKAWVSLENLELAQGTD